MSSPRDLMPMRWARFHSHCINCGSDRRPHRRQGFCQPCHSLQRHVWDAERWDQGDPATCATMPDLPWTYSAIRAGMPRDLSPEEFERLRREIIVEYQIALGARRIAEKAAAPVTGWDIEGRLTLALRLANPRAQTGQFYGDARQIEDGFDQVQKRTIYHWLLAMTDHAELPLDAESIWSRVFPAPGTGWAATAPRL